MPDHPSWPAELVEKAARAVCEAENDRDTVALRYEDWREEYDAKAQAALSALSGDLVPREEHEAEVAKLSAHIDRLCDHSFELVVKASAEDGSDLPPARELAAAVARAYRLLSNVHPPEFARDTPNTRKWVTATMDVLRPVYVSRPTSEEER